MTPLDEPSKLFIEQNINVKIENFLLKSSAKFPDNIKILAEQIAARQKIKEKLPSFYNNLNLILPKSISLEQSSSELTANFKASIANGELLIDLTGGMGVDLLAMSKKFDKAIYLDQNPELHEITKFNFEQLAINNVQLFNENSIKFLQNFKTKIDWIYIDPARRNNAGGKVFSLPDCEPNMLEIKNLLLEKADNILLKCSPMLDITKAIVQLENVSKIYVVCVENEVKELLFHLKNSHNGGIETKVIQLKNNETISFEFDMEAEKQMDFRIGPIQKYLYEPNVGIMKAGGFKTISKIFGVNKLNPNTHLYTSNSIIENFPGRSFEIINILKADKKGIKKHIPKQKANLTIRNFPGTVEDLRKKIELKDGGNDYLFACTNNINEKLILHTIKLR